MAVGPRFSDSVCHEFSSVMGGGGQSSVMLMNERMVRFPTPNSIAYRANVGFQVSTLQMGSRSDVVPDGLRRHKGRAQIS